MTTVPSAILLTLSIIGVTSVGALLYQGLIYAIHYLKHGHLAITAEEIENKYLKERITTLEAGKNQIQSEYDELRSNLYEKLFE